MATTTSRFVRHDLMCTDLPAGRRFYESLFGWQGTDVKVMGSTIVRITAGYQVLGAIMPFDKSFSIPSHWVPYISVDSVDDCCKSASRLGGEICMGAMDIAPGRFAMIDDPQKALFSPFTPKGAVPDQRTAGPGDFCWDTLLTTDHRDAARFYTSLFGWGSSDLDMGNGRAYTLLTNGDAGVAGIWKMSSDEAHRPMWLSYVAVRDTDDTVRRATALGATVVMAPTEAPGVGRLARILDPTGASIGLLQPKS